MMLLSRSRSTDLPVFSTAAVLALAGAVVDLAQRPGRLLPLCVLLGRLALDEALADQRLRADHAVRVGAEVLVARGRRS
jgi:hypothetical protein